MFLFDPSLSKNIKDEHYRYNDNIKNTRPQSSVISKPGLYLYSGS